MLFETGDSDTRVAPLHARKMTALLQATNGSGRPIVLHYDTGFGHVGAQPIAKQIDDLTTEAQFLFWQLGWISGSALAPERDLGPLTPEARARGRGRALVGPDRRGWLRAARPAAAARA